MVLCAILFPITPLCGAQMGDAYYKDGNYHKAIDYHNKGLAIRLEALGRNHPKTQMTERNLNNAKGNCPFM